MSATEKVASTEQSSTQLSSDAKAQVQGKALASAKVQATKQETLQLSRGQRKRQAKRDQYLRKERMIMSALHVKHSDEQAKRIDGLDAIKEALLATVTATTDDQPVAAAQLEKQQKQQPSLLKSNRGRRLLVEKEVTQMNLVLQHPAFIADPFATIHEHLQNTIKPSQPLKRVEVVDKVKRKRKKTKFRATRSRNR